MVAMIPTNMTGEKRGKNNEKKLFKCMATVKPTTMTTATAITTSSVCWWLVGGKGNAYVCMPYTTERMGEK